MCESPEQDFFSKWGQEGTIDFAKTFSELIILTASRTLMGTHTSSIAAEHGHETHQCKHTLSFS